MLEKIVRQIIDGRDISRKEAEFLIDVDLQQLKQAANQIREYFCGNDFDLCSIINGKSGRCSEDCKGESSTHRSILSRMGPDTLPIYFRTWVSVQRHRFASG